MKRWIAGAIALLLTACTSTYHEPQVGTNHPANPDARVAPLPTRSQVLSHAPDEHAHAARMTPATFPTSMPNESAAYVCPMHPAVIADKPDQRCPECGMKLVPKSEVEGHQ